MKDYLTFFRESYDRAMTNESHPGEFLEAFYDNFMSKSDAIALQFTATNMRRQKKMLAMSLQHMVDFSVQRLASDDLRRIAERHSVTQLDVDPGFYDLWLDSLIETVHLFDVRFTEEVELAWRVILAPGVAYMKFKHNKPALNELVGASAATLDDIVD